MKTLKNVVLAGAIVLGMAQYASAQVKIRVTGSTAFGQAFYSALTNTMAAEGGVAVAYDSGKSAPQKAKTYSVRGTLNGKDTIVACGFSGSEAGIQATVKGLNVSFFKDASIPTLPAAGNVTVTAVATSGNTENGVPDACNSDTWQDTSRFSSTSRNRLTNGTYQTYTNLTPVTIQNSGGTNYTTGLEAAGVVGVVTFKFISSSNSVITNVTTYQLQNMYANNGIKLSALSGNVADTNKWVYPIGRDFDSGTRLTMLLQIGKAANGTVNQSILGDSAGNKASATGTAVKVIAPSTAAINSLAVSAGDGGYSSGGDMSAALGNDIANYTAHPYSGTYTLGGLIAYASTADCDANINSGANKEVAFNGLVLGNASAGSSDQTTYGSLEVVTSGKWPFWSYEHMYQASTASADAQAALTKIASKIHNDLAPVRLDQMKASRSADGTATTF